MGEVVVTATRDAQEVRKVPANVTVITADDIQKSGATSVPEVLTGLVGINVTSYSGNASQSIVDMRGFGTEAGYLRNVVMLDGRRLNRPDICGDQLARDPALGDRADRGRAGRQQRPLRGFGHRRLHQHHHQARRGKAEGRCDLHRRKLQHLQRPRRRPGLGRQGLLCAQRRGPHEQRIPGPLEVHHGKRRRQRRLQPHRRSRRLPGDHGQQDRQPVPGRPHAGPVQRQPKAGPEPRRRRKLQLLRRQSPRQDHPGLLSDASTPT